MSAITSFIQVRPLWVSQVSQSLAGAQGVRLRFLQQINRFYDLLLQAIEQNDPRQLEPLLVEWSEARSHTDLDDTGDTTLAVLLNKVLLTTVEILQAELTAAEAWEALVAMLPIYTHALAFASQRETQWQVQHVSGELEKTRVELERLERSKSDFIAIAAHELKTPLTLIEGYVSMLREILPPEYSQQPPTDLYLRGIDAGARRLRAIVDDMIDVSVIDNNLLSLNFQPVWLNRLLAALQRELAETVAARRQVLTIRDFPGSNEMTFGDGERLRQAFRNVLLNSIKYTPDGGAITVDGRLLPGFIEITIADTGIGIDPEDQPRIFEKFGRLGNVALHSSGKTKFKGGGPGLGLPITKGIIEAHGGAIWVESEGYDEAKCPGSTFHILLPILTQPPDDKSARLFQMLLGAERQKSLYGKKTR